MAKAAENYLKMHHPSLHKKMYGKGGKVKKGYKKGGEVSAAELLTQAADYKGNPYSKKGKVIQEFINKSNKAYAEMPGRMKSNVDPEGVTVDAPRMRERKENQRIDRDYRAGAVSEEPTSSDEWSQFNPRHPNFAGYAGGGQVNKAQALQGMGDVVDAKLTPGEIVLNADQQASLEQELGQPIDGLMAKIGVPGFKDGGKVEKKTPEFKVGMYSSTQKFTRERTVAEKRKLKALRTKNRKKKGK